MGPLTLLFRLPLLPVHGVIRIAELVSEQADQELHDPASVRRELEALAAAYQAGELTADQVAQGQRDAVARLRTG